MQTTTATTATTAAAPVAVVVLDDGQTWATAATAALITADAFAFLEAGGRFQDLDPVAIVAEAPVRPPPAPAPATDTTADADTADAEDIDPLRLAALAQHLDLDDEEAADHLEQDDHDPARIEYGRREYVVLTDEEADERAREYMTESLWCFRAGFLASYCSLPASTIETMQAKLCEGFQEAALKLVGDRLDELLNDAISSDGRGPALAHYDHNEEEATVKGTTFYIYRTN